MRRLTRPLFYVLLAALAALAAWTGATARSSSASAASEPASKAAPARRVKVLWLGDNGHHQPLARCRQVFSIFARRGIDFTYTEDVASLNPRTLDRYDCLLLYANIDRIEPSEEKALLDYVESGHGFVPVHCGSYCFLNSPKITALVGARFKSHGTGVFKETIVQPDHPIEKGLKPIESWDETYVHEMHNEQGRTVLGYRIDGNHKEPYTWVREQGKGRVFYTAWGHDERTWGNADFQALLEHGVRWAAGDWAIDWRPLPAEPEVHTDNPIPNYLPSAKWGAEGAQIHEMQEPLRPAESMKHMVLPPGFEARLFASDPDIYKPICMAFDERGRLWIAETLDYPNSMQQPGEGHDRIVICQPNADGVADKFTVFADKLSIPTSICFASGGLVVAQAPDMLFLKSSHGDDHADVRKTLFTGFGIHDTHAGPSNLRWGFDNWIYGSIGYSGFKGTVGGQAVSFGEGIFRFKPDGSAIEFLGSTTNNTWGLGFSEDNNLFASTANNAPSFYLHIPNRYYEQVKGWTVKGLAPIDDDPSIYPLSDKVRQMDNHGRYTAGAGSALYTARSFPRDYWNRVAFVAEPTGHVLGQFLLEPNGSGFIARNNFNLLESDDEWTAPINGEVGPDGAVWMSDWYNFIVQHNPIPHGFVGGRGGAYVTPLRDKSHGRIYRIVYTGAKPSQTFNLSNASTEQLTAALKSDNMLWRMHAQRLLVEKGDKSAAPALEALASDPSVDETGQNPPAVHALWTLSGLGEFDGTGDPAAVAAAEKALHSPAAGVRRAAAQTLPRTDAGAEAILAAGLLNDRDPQVRKWTLLSLSEMPPSPAVGDAVFALLRLARGAGDPWIDDAMTIAAAHNDASFLKAAFAAYPAPTTAPAAPTSAPAAAANLIPNGSFERVVGGKPADWSVRHYSGEATQDLASTGRGGGTCVRLQSSSGSDTSWHVDVPVVPHTQYRLSGWIKTDHVRATRGGLGALLNVHLTPYKTRAITGTHDWQQVKVTFDSGDQTRVSINCLFGGWGWATGTAYYDDIELTEGRGSSLGLGEGGRVIEAVVNAYAQRGPVDSVVATIAAARSAQPALTDLALDALAAGWPKSAVPTLSDADVAQLRAAMTGLSADGRDRLLALAERWGKKDLFSAQLADAVRDLRAQVARAGAGPAQRADAASRLLRIGDNDAALDLILQQINPRTGVDTQVALLGALQGSRNPAVGKAVVQRWETLTPEVRKEALELLLHRQPWAEALLDGIKARTVGYKDLLPQQWETLTSWPDADLASRAKAIATDAGAGVNSDRKALVEKNMPLLKEKGDAVLGRKVFEKNCMVCHTIEGQGGKVGPDLTGIGARPKVDNLTQILDPNRSVEGTWKEWTARTDDDVVIGRLFSESKTSVQIIDAAGQIHSLQRDEIRSLKSSDKGVMPEGFERLPSQDIVNVLEYLATSRVKH